MEEVREEFFLLSVRQVELATTLAEKGRCGIRG